MQVGLAQRNPTTPCCFGLRYH